jgi:proteasome lid subunit RPN8/RPN11
MKLRRRAPAKGKAPKPGGPVKAINKDVLELILASGEGSLPKEFGGVLRAYDGVITEVMVLPGTEQGARAALFKFYMLPVDHSVVGTAHSHPSGVYWPSGADLELFDRFGSIHVICCRPFGPNDWQAYDSRGRVREIEVLV